MEIWVVIPAYNEEKTIEQVVNSVLKFVKNILIVDDCSSDKTSEILGKLPVKVIRNSINLGYTETLEKGVEQAFKSGGDYVITFDADGQHQAGDLPKYIEAIRDQEPDLVVGKRSFKNRFMENIWILFSRKYGFSDPLCGFKAYRRSTYKKFGPLESVYTIGTQLLFLVAKNKGKIIEVELNTKERLDKPRFAGRIRGNYLELKALVNLLRVIS